MTKKKSPIKKQSKLSIWFVILIFIITSLGFLQRSNWFITRNWTRHEFTKLGFSLKLPPNWIIFPESIDTSEISVEMKVINDFDPMGQYYMDKVINGQSMFFGPQEIISNAQSAKPYQEFTNRKDLIHASFLFNGMLKEDSEIRIGNRVATYAESNSTTEAFIPISELEGRTYGLVLIANNIENKILIKRIVKTIKFNN